MTFGFSLCKNIYETNNIRITLFLPCLAERHPPCACFWVIIQLESYDPNVCVASFVEPPNNHRGSKPRFSALCVSGTQQTSFRKTCSDELIFLFGVAFLGASSSSDQVSEIKARTSLDRVASPLLSPSWRSPEWGTHGGELQERLFWRWPATTQSWHVIWPTAYTLHAISLGRRGPDCTCPCNGSDKNFLDTCAQRSTSTTSFPCAIRPVMITQMLRKQFFGVTDVMGPKSHPKSGNTKKHRVHTNFSEKFARTLAFLPVIRVRNPTGIVQNNLFRCTVLLWVDFGRWIFLLKGVRVVGK